MNELKLPSFKNPVPKDEAVAAYAHWQYGDPVAHVAAISKMSTKKVSEIISAFPNEWKECAAEYSKNWN